MAAIPCRRAVGCPSDMITFGGEGMLVERRQVEEFALLALNRPDRGAECQETVGYFFLRSSSAFNSRWA